MFGRLMHVILHAFLCWGGFTDSAIYLFDESVYWEGWLDLQFKVHLQCVIYTGIGLSGSHDAGHDSCFTAWFH